MSQELEYDFSGDETRICRIKQGWNGVGRTGQYFGKVSVSGQFWAIILWDGSDDPDMHKSAGIEVMEHTWVGLDTL
jgi:hypothetical protein